MIQGIDRSIEGVGVGVGVESVSRPLLTLLLSGKN